MFWAVNDNQPEVLEILLEAGLKPNKIDARLNTPLHYAVTKEFQDIIDLLPARRQTKEVDASQEEFFNLDTEYDDLKNGRPMLRRDIFCILVGVKCESLMKLFRDADVDLWTFLTATNDDLVRLGIPIPYKRNRILSGLHRLHKASYRPQSVHIVGQHELYSTEDLAKALLTAVRQVIAMEASLAYVSRNYGEFGRRDTYLMDKIREVEGNLGKIEAVCSKLKERVAVWDKENAPADLIPRGSSKKKIRWLRAVPLFGVSALVALMVLRRFL